MSKFLVLALAICLCLSVAGLADAHEVRITDQWLALDGDFYRHDNSVRLSYLEATFDDTGLTFLRFRLTAMRGTVRFDDMHVVSQGKVTLKLSEKHKLGFDLHVFESVVKHYEEKLFLVPPVKGFDRETGQVKWYLQADGKKYLVTWTMKDNTVVTEEISG